MLVCYDKLHKIYKTLECDIGDIIEFSDEIMVLCKNRGGYVCAKTINLC